MSHRSSLMNSSAEGQNPKGFPTMYKLLSNSQHRERGWQNSNERCVNGR